MKPRQHRTPFTKYDVASKNLLCHPVNPYHSPMKLVGNSPPLPLLQRYINLKLSQRQPDEHFTSFATPPPLDCYEAKKGRDHMNTDLMNLHIMNLVKGQLCAN